LDPYGHVNHAVYVTWFEVARTEALRSLGVHLSGPASHGVSFVVAELSVRYRQPALADDLVEVSCALTELGGVSSRWRHEVRRHGELLADGWVRIGALGPSGRPTRLAPEVHHALHSLLET
jgi:YbgC/YbaW family acyl-CoA thioester hydrolase